MWSTCTEKPGRLEEQKLCADSYQQICCWYVRLLYWFLASRIHLSFVKSTPKRDSNDDHEYSANNGIDSSPPDVLNFTSEKPFITQVHVQPGTGNFWCWVAFRGNKRGCPQDIAETFPNMLQGTGGAREEEVDANKRTRDQNHLEA